MVFIEATIGFPLIAGHAWHKGAWKNRRAREFSKLLDQPPALSS
jgi:deoxyhypusine synthase